MKTVKDFLSQHKSYYAASIYHDVTATQLTRLADGEAKVDESGQVWIKSKTKLVVSGSEKVGDDLLAEMYEMLESVREDYGFLTDVGKDIDKLLAKARGEYANS